jgi:hypothetical protein
MKKLLYLVVSVFIIACNNDDNDSTAPVVTLIGESSITVSQSSTYEDAGATATDNQDGDLTSSIVTTSNVDTSTLGTYTVVHSVSDAAGNVGSASRQVDVGVPAINVLWQSPPRFDSITAMKVALINPAKFVISIEGPGADSSSTTGPNKAQLYQFITDLTTSGYTGTLVMHPDTASTEWAHDWNNGSTDVPADGWKKFINYFKELNDTLVVHTPVFPQGLRPMTELLIETGNGTTMPHTTTTGDPFPSITSLNDLFTSFKTYMNDPSFTISATGDWLRNYFPTSADYYYAQMYDMCSPPVGTIYPCLCGVNIPDASGERAQLIAESMVPLITGTGGVGALPTSSDPPSRLDKVSFIFTYAPTATSSAPGQNSPMFGEHDYFWTKSQFTNGTIMENDAIKQTGFIWWFKTKMDVHYSHAGISGRASTGLWHSEVILDARWNTIP